MQESYEYMYHQIEKTHWWYLGRRELIVKLINKYYQNKNISILEVGCSSGVLLEDLRSLGFNDLTGADISTVAVNNSINKGLNVVHTNGDNLKMLLGTKKFDLIIASDVLEHIPQDKKAIDEWAELVQPNGLIFVFVPAFNSLWSIHDDVNLHHKRYVLPELIKLTPASTQIILQGYWNCLMFIPVFLVRFFFKNKEKKIGDLKIHSPLVNKLLELILRVENFLILKKIQLPFGVSTFCVYKKTK